MIEETKALNTLFLHSEEALVLLRQTLERAKEHEEGSSSNNSKSSLAQPGQVVLPPGASPHSYKFGDIDSSSEEEEEDQSDSDDSSSRSSSSSSAPSENAGQETGDPDLIEESTDKATPLSTSKEPSQTPTKARKKKLSAAQQSKQNRQRNQLVKQLLDNLQKQNLRLDDDRILQLPSNLLHRQDLRSDLTSLQRAQIYTNLADEMQQKKPVIVMLVKSGRFAGGVFVGSDCVTHRTFQHYTIRKGQGKAQSSQDNSKRKAKSMGAQLRRAGEQSMKEDIHATIMDWKEHFASSCLILLSCPKTMKSTIFADTVENVISKNDSRIRKVPFDVGRPTFESVCISYEVLTTVTLREASSTGTTSEPLENAATLSTPISNQASEKSSNSDNTNEPKKEEEKEEKNPAIALTRIHEICRDGNATELLELLDSKDILTKINQAAGPDFMTPLHYAAESSSLADPVSAAACVMALLSKGEADPTIVDARLRTPYFLASHDKVREAFRKARANLGEDFCDWSAAKVGSPLTEDDIQEKKEREAEKRRRKKARQKEKKAQEKAEQEEEERQKQQQEEERKGREVAKRIRDGLAPKLSTAANVCDFCQTVCRGKKRAQMFKRLDYAYCSTKCVNEHKRELMAKAALARFG
jgi:hypothetical protein